MLFDNSTDLDATHVVLPDDALLACNDHPSSSPSRKSSPSAPFITKQVLEQIRSTITNTIRPAWQSHLPTNFGCAEHGKLKADQWRTALEFDIPVALVKVVASRRKSGNIGDDERAQRIVDHTMDLAMAMAWGLSRHTSQSHAERYMSYMKRYIQDIQKLYPDYAIKPTHHYALHIPDMLTGFGPLHGTWAFGLERLIGRLQSLNTNSKPGVCTGNLSSIETDILF